MNIQAFKKRFDPILGRTLEKAIVLSRDLTNDAFTRETVDYSRVLLMAGGKRVRPFMAWLAYKASGGVKDKQALETFVGLELFHAFALVHDDIMDRGTSRHGVKTTHVFVADQLKRLKRGGDLARLGESQAILLGDLLFLWATECIAGTACWNEFRRMVQEVIVGQMIDVDIVSRKNVEDELISEKMRLKTASYTFVQPLRMGVALAGGSTNMMRFCEDYGMPLGLAFQIQDDLIDLLTPAMESGKTSFSDLSEGQHTVFTQYIRVRGTAKQKRELEALVGSELSERDRTRVMDLFESSGAIEHGRMLIEGYFEQALEALTIGGLTKKRAEPFEALIEYIRLRTI